MNTLKFLAVGSSLDSGRDVIGRYRVRAASLLPRFEPGEEPAPAPAPAGPAATAAPRPWWQPLLHSLLPRFEPGEEPAPAPTAPAATAPAAATAAPRPWWQPLLHTLRRLRPSRKPTTSHQTPAASEQSPVTSAQPPATSDPLPTANAQHPTPNTQTTARRAEPQPQPEPARRPIQREFRFQHVTPICNDLHDADLEIIPQPHAVH